MILVIISIVISPPNIFYDYDDPKAVLLQCKSDNIDFIIDIAYNMLLVLCCTFYAIRTRKIPENFNETKFIGFAMYSICIIWAAYFAIYVGTNATAGSSKAAKSNYKV